MTDISDDLLLEAAMTLAVSRGRVTPGPSEEKDARRILEKVVPMVRKEAFLEASMRTEKHGRAYTSKALKMQDDGDATGSFGFVAAAVACEKNSKALRKMADGEATP
jgi:hypothetical protein